jgi:hypothetical protein
MAGDGIKDTKDSREKEGCHKSKRRFGDRRQSQEQKKNERQCG